MRRGKGNALAAGFAKVTGDVVVMFDADGSADADGDPPVRRGAARGRRLRQGLAVPARRRERRHHRVRRLGNRFLHTWMNVSFKTRFTDLCYGYNAFWADLIPLLDLPDHELVSPAGSPMLWGDGFEIETADQLPVRRAPG